MSLSVAYIALFTGVAVWLVLVRSLRVKPWELQHASAVPQASGLPPAKMGLWVFLAVVTSLFALFISAYYMRMGHGHGPSADWVTFAKPTVLWLNTAILIASSVAMQWARSAEALGQVAVVRSRLQMGVLFTTLFVIGQVYAWGQLTAAGYVSPRNPAIAFFYLLTAVHALHMLGGLFVAGRAWLRLRQPGIELIDVRLSLQLCTTYWHYLLLVWLVLFALLLST